MWVKEPDPYFNYTEFLDFHLSTAHSDSNMSANGVKRVYSPQTIPPDGVKFQLAEVDDEDYVLEEIKKVFANRRTSWDFSRKMSINHLSILLKAALGVTDICQYGSHKVLKKAYPSAGGEYSVNIYVYLQYFNNEAIDQTLHQYKPEDETLIKIKRLTLSEINAICSTSKYTSNEFSRANCVFFLTTDYKLLFSKYGKLAYRLAFLEAGHICQNIQIVSSMMNISSVPLGGFYDEYVKKLLELEEEYCLYALAMG